METIQMGYIGRKKMYSGETAWDDKGNNVISHIIVCYDKSGVLSIQFGYVKNGALVSSKQYGSTPSEACSTRIVRLKHETEFVTGISEVIYDGRITSLTFHTNQRKHEAVHLTFDSIYIKKIELQSGILERPEFGGFFGTCYNSILNSIGFHVNLLLPDVKTIKKENV